MTVFSVLRESLSVPEDDCPMSAALKSRHGPNTSPHSSGSRPTVPSDHFRYERAARWAGRKVQFTTEHLYIQLVDTLLVVLHE